MPKKSSKKSHRKPKGDMEGCCKVESVICIDTRGQMVLPKEIRDKAKIIPGDKLAVVSWQKGKGACCIYLMKADDFSDAVKDFLGPMRKKTARK